MCVDLGRGNLQENKTRRRTDQKKCDSTGGVFSIYFHGTTSDSDTRTVMESAQMSSRKSKYISYCSDFKKRGRLFDAHLIVSHRSSRRHCCRGVHFNCIPLFYVYVVLVYIKPKFMVSRIL